MIKWDFRKVILYVVVTEQYVVVTEQYVVVTEQYVVVTEHIWSSVYPSLIIEFTFKPSYSYIFVMFNHMSMTTLHYLLYVRKVWRYERGNHNPQIEGQTTQW
jgi:hypothetical protein